MLEVEVVERDSYIWKLALSIKKAWSKEEN